VPLVLLCPTFPYTYSFIVISTTTARTALYNNIHNILTKHGLAERFERLGHVDLLRLFLFGVPDGSTPVSVAVFGAVHEFRKCCNRF